MIVAGIDSSIVAALISGGVAFFLALIGVAWRLGALANGLKELMEDVHEMKGDIRDLRRINPFPNRREEK